jgi:serine/threonine protein kinase
MGDTSRAGANKIIGEYELLSKLGAGGMGSVFRAKNRRTGQIVAFKVLMPSDAKNERMVKRFQRESKIALGLSHPNIVAGIDGGVLGNLCYLAMEFVDGESLADMLRRQKRLDRGRTVDMMLKIASGLAHAHREGLIHRDVKPENILVGRDGAVKICDLGLAREVADTGFTMMGAALGTPRYMSPEQVAGLKTIDARTDIYSLGATVYHMLTGQTPYQAKSSVMMMAAQVSGKFTPVCDVAPDVDPALAQVVERCMRKDPNERYQTADELIADLTMLQSGGRTTTAPGRPARAGVDAQPQQRRAARKKKSSGGCLVLVGVVVVLGVIAAGVWAAVWGPLRQTSAEFIKKLNAPDREAPPPR